MKLQMIGIALVASAGLTMSASAIDLDFPSPDSISGGPTGSGPLGAGGGGVHYMEGDDRTETFLGTGLPSVPDSQWVFSMDDWTDVGVLNTFDIEINGTVVGSFEFTGVGISSTIVDFDLVFSHAPVAGDDYTLRMVATSTVPPGLASWNWFPGGTVTLVPAPASAMLLGMAGLVGIRRRR
jgi:hypothetical protein